MGTENFIEEYLTWQAVAVFIFYTDGISIVGWQPAKERDKNGKKS